MNSFQNVLKELRQEYNRRPYNFYGFAGFDKKGRLIELYTNKILAWGFIHELHGIVGVTIDLPNKVRQIIEEHKYGEFGLRQLSERLMDRVVLEFVELGDLTDKTKREVMLYAPIPKGEITKPEQSVQGPRNISFPISEPLAMLEYPLEAAFFRELQKKYAQYG